MSRSRETVRGLIHGPNRDRFISSESEIERRFILCALHSSTVTSVVEQPLEVTIESPKLRYIPDYCLTLLSGQKQIVEIKPAEKVDTDESLRLRLTRIAFALNAHGLLFTVVTDRDFSDRYHLANLRLLKRYLSYRISDVSEASRLLTQGIPPTFGELSLAVSCPHIALGLIAQKYVQADQSKPIGVESSIYVQGAENEPPYFDGWYPTDHTWQKLEDREHFR